MVKMQGVLGFLGGVVLSCQAVAYTGKIKCDKLENALAYMPYPQVGRFCQDALEGCELQKMLNNLDVRHPLHPILSERLQDYINLTLEKCELAIHIHDPRFYKKHLHRRGEER